MNAQEAEAAYRVVKSQFDAGQISLDEYNRRVSELRYQDNSGTWWSISPQDGSWLKWNGTTWEPAFAHAAVATPAPHPVAKPAHQQAQPAAQPSWYIPPVSAQQKPATQPATAQPVQQPVYQQPVQQPVAQPAAAPSYYIPPSGAAQQPVVQQPATAVTQPVAPSIRQPWSRAKKFAVVSILFGAVALFRAPYIAGIIGVLLGALAVREKEKLGIIGIAIAVIAMAINFLYIFIA
ncbi:MAG: hypothetical protein NTV10_07375 [Methanoregula sp.]|nr:hypothetical protein [Methanoregula sp.]